MEMDAEQYPPNFNMDQVHQELEKLNIATDVINKLELQLDEARHAFRQIQSEWTQRLDALIKRHAASIEKAKPYFESRSKLKEADELTQTAANRYHSANRMHEIAKTQVKFTQQSLSANSNMDPACLEVMNHHIQRVNDAEKERVLSEHEHKLASQVYIEMNERVNRLEKECKRAIRKSQAYFDARVKFTTVLVNQKELIGRVETEIKQKKRDYAASLRALEAMSDEIHESRSLGRREQGVGAENPEPPPVEIASGDTAAGGALCAQASELVVVMRKQQPEAEAHSAVVLPSSSPTLKMSATVSTFYPEAPNDLLVAAAEETSRDRSCSAPVDPSTLSLNLTAVSPSDLRKQRSKSGGVLLVAEFLSQYDSALWGEDKRLTAFSFPPDEDSYDCHYKTAPDGVKPFPTPPDTPLDTPTAEQALAACLQAKTTTAIVRPQIVLHSSVNPRNSMESTASSLFPEPADVSGLSTAAVSDSGSLSSFNLSFDDEKIEKFLIDHTDLMRAIEPGELDDSSSSDDPIVNEFIRRGGARTAGDLLAGTKCVDDLPERSSGSGESIGEHE